MPRVEISLPPKFGFTCRIPIRIGDINRASHLSHVNMISILEEARAQYLVSLGYADEVNIHNGHGTILGDLAVIFKGQGHYGQTLQIEIGVTDFREKSFDMVYRVTDAADGRLVALAKTAILVYHYETQKVVPVPADLKARFLELQKE